MISKKFKEGTLIYVRGYISKVMAMSDHIESVDKQLDADHEKHLRVWYNPVYTIEVGNFFRPQVPLAMWDYKSEVTKYDGNCTDFEKRRNNYGV